MRSAKFKAIAGSFIGVAAMLVAACGSSTTTTGPGTSTSFAYHYQTPTKTGGTVVASDWQAYDSANLIVNAYQNGTVIDSEVDSLLYDSCVVQLPDLKLATAGFKMSQCKSVDESADGTTTTMHLDPQAKWSDGAPITSNDYRLWYDIFADPNQVGGTAGPPWDTATVAFPDANTVVINWHAPYAPYFINLLGAMPSQEYKDAFDPTKPFTQTKTSDLDPGYNATALAADFAKPANLQTPIVNGPFKVDSYTSDVLTLVPNPNYFSNTLHKTTLDKFIFKSAGQKDVEIQSYKAGGIDHAEDFTEGDLPKFSDIPAAEVQQTAAFQYEHLELNQRNMAPNANGGKDGISGKSVFTNADFRKAFAMSLNRCAMIEGILGLPCAKVLTNEFTAPIDPSYDTNAPYPAYSVAGANTILDGLNMKRDAKGKRTYPGTTDEITLQMYTTFGNPIRESFLELIKQDLGTVGITAVVNQSHKFFAGYDAGGILKTGVYDVGLFTFSTPADGDSNTAEIIPSQIPGKTNPGGQNYSGLNDPQLVTYLDNGRKELDSAKRIAIYKQFYDYVAQQNYIIPLYSRLDISLTKTTLGNYLQHPTSVGNFWNVSEWFQKASS